MEKGFIALSTVLVIMSVVVAVVMTVALLSIGEAQSSLAIYLGEDNLAAVEGCVEDVMLKIRADQTYSGTTISRPDGVNCSITYNPGGSGPTDWDLTITTNTTSYQRKIRAILTRNPTGITLTSWQEI